MLTTEGRVLVESEVGMTTVWGPLHICTATVLSRPNITMASKMTRQCLSQMVLSPLEQNLWCPDLFPQNLYFLLR